MLDLTSWVKRKLCSPIIASQIFPEDAELVDFAGKSTLISSEEKK